MKQRKGRQKRNPRSSSLLKTKFHLYNKKSQNQGSQALISRSQNREVIETLRDEGLDPCTPACKAGALTPELSAQETIVLKSNQQSLSTKIDPKNDIVRRPLKALGLG